MSKLTELLKYSNPKLVFKVADELTEGNFELAVSTRQNKKYMIKSPITKNKWVHFGQMGYEDYTKHKNKERREQFRKRNAYWSYRPMNSPAFLSYYLLW